MRMSEQDTATTILYAHIQEVMRERGLWGQRIDPVNTSQRQALKAALLEAMRRATEAPPHKH